MRGVCFALILGILAASVASSYWLPRFRENCERINVGSSVAPIAEGEDEEDDAGQGPLDHRVRGGLTGGLDLGSTEDKRVTLAPTSFDRTPLERVEGANVE